jgi:hypothetical protein
MNLYNVLISIFEEKLEDDKKEDVKDVKTIEDFIDNYKIFNIKNLTVSFGYSTLGLEASENLESINLNDLKNIEGLEIETGNVFEINNNNVTKVLLYIKTKLQRSINQKVSAGGTLLPFIIIISWSYLGINYILTSNYTNKKLIIYEYSINGSKNQVEKINRFISKRGIIKNSPFRLLGSILVYHDWVYDWNMIDFKKDVEERRLNE